MTGSRTAPDKATKDVQLYSMTGFGAKRQAVAGVELDIVLRSVNSRYLDLIFKLPDDYFVLESRLRELIKSQVRRGRIEIIVKRSVVNPTTLVNRLNSDWVNGMLKAYQAQAEIHGCNDEDFQKRGLLQLLRAREAFGETLEAIGTEEQTGFIDLVRQALADLIVMRAQEGDAIKKELVGYAQKLMQLREQIGASKENLIEQLKEKLLERLKPMLSDNSLDPQRVAMEAAFLAERADISEELNRLESHLYQFDQTLLQDPQGKKLEFITQEIGREFNTIGSKVQNSAIQTLVIEAKSCLEKIREQCANME